MTPRDFIAAARVPDSLPSQEFGLWTIRRQEDVEPAIYGFPSITLLHCVSLAGLHLPYGEIVMEDSITELRRHLGIWMPARGRVLITGLGLGCVVRGLLIKDDVEHIDVLEIDRDIIDRVGVEFADNPRVTIRQGDAMKCRIDKAARWDFAWHDLWKDGTDLQLDHAKLFDRFRPHCGQQGAWAFPRMFARAWPYPLLGSPKRRVA